MLITEIKSGGLYFVIDRDDVGRTRLIHFSNKPFDRENYKMENYSWFHSLLELHMLGYDTNDHHASRHTMTSPPSAFSSSWDTYLISKAGLVIVCLEA